jgi:hypothetical protein
MCSTHAPAAFFSDLPAEIDMMPACCSAAVALRTAERAAAPAGGRPAAALSDDVLEIIFSYVGALAVFMVLPRVCRQYARVLRVQHTARVFRPCTMFCTRDVSAMPVAALLAIMRRVKKIDTVDLTHCVFALCKDVDSAFGCNGPLATAISDLGVSALTVDPFIACAAKQETPASVLAHCANSNVLRIHTEGVEFTKWQLRDLFAGTCGRVQRVALPRCSIEWWPPSVSRTGFGQCFKNLAHLTLDYVASVSTGVLSFLAAHARGLVHLSLRACDAEFGSGGIDAIATLHDLEYLDLYDSTYCVISGDYMLARLSELRALRHLDVGCVLFQPTFVGLRRLVTMSALRVLGVYGTSEFCNAMLGLVARTLSLRVLWVGATSVTSLGPLTAMKSLRTLSANDTNLTDCSLVHVRDLHVTSLSIAKCNALTPAAIAGMRLPLRVDRICVQENGLRDADLAELYNCHPDLAANAIVCNFKGPRFIRAVLERGGCSELTVLHAQATPALLTPFSLHTAGARALTALTLSHCGLRNPHLTHLASACCLATLLIAFNENVSSLGDLPDTLVALDISYTGVACAALVGYANRAPRLAAVYACGCTGAVDMRRALLAATISCSINRDGAPPSGLLL